MDNDTCKKILQSYKGDRFLKERNDTFRPFKKLGPAKCMKVHKSAMKVQFYKMTYHNTPEELYDKILNIADLNVPLLENKRALSKGIFKLLGSDKVKKGKHIGSPNPTRGE